MLVINKTGLDLPPMKEKAVGLPIAPFVPAGSLFVPLGQMRCKACVPCVSPGDRVYKNQLLAVPEGASGCPVYSPVSGRVEEIRRINHPAEGDLLCAVITFEGFEEEGEGNAPAADPHRLSATDIISVARQYGIVDRTTGEPLHTRLYELTMRRYESVVLDCVEDEPYVSGGLSLLTRHLEQACAYLELLAQAFEIPEVSVMYFHSGTREEKKLPKSVGRVKLVRAGGKYPARHYMAKAVPNAFFIGIEACLALARAIGEGVPHTTVTLSVGGDCVVSPRNITVPAGTRVGDILHSFEMENSPQTAVLGGPFTGKSIRDDFTPVTLSTQALLVFGEPKTVATASCFSCGRCALVCPEGLLPLNISRYASFGKFEECEKWGALRCISCGNCSYICRGNTDPLMMIRNAKTVLAQKKKNGD